MPVSGLQCASCGMSCVQRPRSGRPGGGKGEEDCPVVFYLVADIIETDCFINSQGPWPGLCGRLRRSPWKTAALALFLFLRPSVYDLVLYCRLSSVFVLKPEEAMGDSSC